MKKKISKKLVKKSAKKLVKKIHKKLSKKPVKKTVAKPQAKSTKKYNKKDILEFKKIIDKLRMKVSGDISGLSEDTLKRSQKDASGDISGYAFHMADVATDAYDREFSLGLVSSERQLFYELDDALKRMQEGIYGVCEDCSGLITKIRLKAVPYARLCLKCQEKREVK